jgi:hypothetical protein
MADSRWDRWWLNQLWRLHLHHVGRTQRLRHRLREVESALAWAHQCAAEQTERRLEAEDREKAAAAMVADMGIDAMSRWLADDEDLP